jgi:prevent-host-death family protein
MQIVDIPEARCHLARLVGEAAEGKPFVIAKAGKPLVKVTALDIALSEKGQRLGFTSGQNAVPEDFDSMNRAEIQQLFGSQ